EGRSSTQMQTEALQARLQDHAKHQTGHDRLKQANQALFMCLFSDAEAFLKKHPHWTLSYELQPLEEAAVRYYSLKLPLPGQELPFTGKHNVWMPAQQQATKNSSVYHWPLVQAKVEFLYAEGLNQNPSPPELWKYHWCAHSRQQIEVKNLALQPDTRPLENGDIWLGRLATCLPEESHTQRLMTRQITFAPVITAWQLDEGQVKDYLTEALANFQLSL
ncbi:hypothetical protein, partial [Ectothiorhodospira lacustris]|uniref:hypothetical protein n=1 Tax=Ectothiorhodospira lacustris TaxID=2899127 RepID=UPI001EE9486C